MIDLHRPPSPQALNRLLLRCNEETHSPKKLALAFEKSICISIFEKSTGKLSGFVRATSDKGLNANLWNLVAQPGRYQGIFLDVLIHHALGILRREMPGCSISVSAPSMAMQSLQEQGFLLDPGGIRAMGFKLR